VADLLEAVLLEREVDLALLPPPAGPEESKKLRLRKFLDSASVVRPPSDAQRVRPCFLCCGSKGM
jgi:hypothetical protein